MSRSMLLVFLLLILVITSQFEWKQPLVTDIVLHSGESHKQEQVLRTQEVVKGKIILSQEKTIQRLNELVSRLEKQLQHCRISNDPAGDLDRSLTEDILELGRHPFLDD